MDCMLQFAYERADGGSVPSPVDNTGDLFWYLHGCEQAQEFAQAGFTDLLTPPMWKGGSMGGGYDPYNHYDIGGFGPTRFGSREHLQMFAAMLKANGIRMHNDNVLAHMDGGQDGGYTYSYRSSGGAGMGRFPKDRRCFVGPNVPRDNVAAPGSDFAYLFGRQLSYYSGYYGDGQGLNGRGYVLRNMVDALDWLYRALELAGGRFDNTKSMDPSVIRTILTSKAMNNTFGVGEFYDGNPDTLGWWCFDSGIQGRSSAFDYTLYFQLRDMCMNASRWDMRRLVGAGFCHRANYNAVTFAENHDTDTGGSPIIWNKVQAYAVIMTFPGLPCVYYKDWSDDKGCYNLKKYINNLMWIRRILAGGATAWRFSDQQAIVYERLGYGDQPGVLVGINNDSNNGWRQVTVQTHWGPNTRLHDYSGHGDDKWTDWQGKVTIWLPPNDNGRGYVCYAPDGYQGRKIPVNNWGTTQVFEGHPQLDIPAAKAESLTKVMRVCVKEGTQPVFRLQNTQEQAQGLKPMLFDAKGNAISGKIPSSGMYQVAIQSEKLVDQPFKLATTYQAPQLPVA
jgi:alpha-amylase